MQVRVITMRYQEGLQGFPEDALQKVTFGRTVLGVSEHFFVHGNMPHLSYFMAMGEGSSSGSNRVKRGGSWNNDESNCTSSNRNNNNPSNTNNNNGFRLSSTLGPHSRMKGPIPLCRRSACAETNMHLSGRPVASANAAPDIFFSETGGL